MKKIHLRIESLEVVSFETDATPAARGTVHGNVHTRGASCDATCPNTIMDPSCEISCDPSCISTCPVAPCFTGDETCVC